MELLQREFEQNPEHGITVWFFVPLFLCTFIVILQLMLKIRLQRVGRKHEPSFRLVLTDSKNSTKSGRFTEMLGSYDPRKTSEAFKPERIQHWLAQGASATATVHNLLVRKGIIRGKKIDVSAGSAPVVVAAETPSAPQAPVESPPAPVEEAPQEAPVEPETAPVEATPAPETPVAETPAETTA